jgi:hypothetical protein
MTGSALFNEILNEIAPAQREAFRRDYQAITQLPGAGTDLQQFLDDVLEHVVRLYAATAGAIWFRGPDGRPLSARAKLGYDRLGLDGDYEQPHFQLLEYGLSQTKAFVVSPFSAPQPNASVSNPTDSFVVLGPIDNRGERLGVVELCLGPTPIRGKTPGDRRRYALWLDHLTTYICQGIELRFLGSSAPLQPALVNLTAAKSEIEAFKNAICKSLEVTINSYAGMSFGSLRNNQAFTKNVHELLDGNGLRVECPECGSPAILRCQSAGNSKTGVFLYDHYLDSGRTFHGGPSTFPVIKVVAKPPRRRPV